MVKTGMAPKEAALVPVRLGKAVGVTDPLTLRAAELRVLWDMPEHGMQSLGSLGHFLLDVPKHDL